MRDACRYIIQPHENSTWRVQVEGQNENPLPFDTKAEAIAHATKAASIHSPCRVLVQHEDGSFEDEIVYTHPAEE